MNPTPSLRRLKSKIQTLQRKLTRVGPLHPGSVSLQYQVCGNPGCRCMNPKRPKRHGPYYKLAYVYRGTPVCRFVRADCLAELQKRLANYKTFRSIVDALISISIQQGQLDLFAPKSTQGKTSHTSPRPSHRPARRPRSSKNS